MWHELKHKARSWAGLCGAASLWLAGAQDACPAATPEPPVARVVVAHQPGATRHLQPQGEIVQRMVDAAVMQLTGQGSVGAAWRSLAGTQEVIGLKVYAEPGRLSGTRPAVVAAIARGLLQAGTPASHIIIWDREREPLMRAGFGELAAELGVRLAAVNDRGYDQAQYYERAAIGTLVYGDIEFGKSGPGAGRRSYVARLVTRDIQRHIVITPLFNHNHLEVTGHLYNLALGGVDNTRRFESNPTLLMEAVAEIFALEWFSDRVVLCVTDALLAQYEGQQRSLLHYSAVLDEVWMSRDPVVLDVVGRDRLEQLRTAAKASRPKVKNELFANAALLELGVADPKAIRVERLP